MSDWMGWSLWAISGVWWGWLLWKLRKVEGHVNKIMEVLAAASPELERRVLEQGTQVVLNKRMTWRDDVEEEG